MRGAVNRVSRSMSVVACIDMLPSMFDVQHWAHEHITVDIYKPCVGASARLERAVGLGAVQLL